MRNNVGHTSNGSHVPSAKEHYDQHLGRVYAWMLGDFDDAVESAYADLLESGFRLGDHGVAIDLGAGNGVYAVALAELGYSVVAIDSCAALLRELSAAAGDRDIRSALGDLTSFPQFVTAPAEAVVCMGDTLTHLESRSAVEQLLRDVRTALVPGGVFVATFRDYVSAELVGADRFIPVRSDSDRILTCFLDYREDSVLVHDIVQERSDAGWSTTVGVYPKLRLDPGWVLAAATRAGLEATISGGPRGMARLVGRCPTSAST
jgi:SAM-dependent methyltransferase